MDASSSVPACAATRRPRPARWRARVVALAASVMAIAVYATRLASAQSFDDVGTRAMGMAGAFVAVADDATATWWNPAGLAGGAFFSAVVERRLTSAPADVPDAGPAARTREAGFALAYPALGLSYYRFRVSERGQFDSIGAVDPGRQDQGRAASLTRSAAVSAFGATVGQSLGQHLVVASTVRLLRVGAVVSTEVGPDALDRIEDAPVDRHTVGDLDVGAMVRVGGLTVGGVVRHVGEPDVGDGEDRFTLSRQARAGVAFKKGRAGVFDSLVGAVDVDLTTTATVFGDERRVAAGGELGIARGRVALRAGLSRNTVGLREWQKTAGASLALGSSVYVDGAVAPKAWTSEPSRAGWSVSLRTAF